jgi:hypothetical protein
MDEYITIDRSWPGWQKFSEYERDKYMKIAKAGYYRPEKETPARHPNSARFHEILKELGELHDRKQADYGRGEDPFANVRASSAWGIPSWAGAMLRADDKVRRLQSLIVNGKLSNESAEDSFRDIAVYAIIGLCLFEEERDSAD